MTEAAAGLLGISAGVFSGLISRIVVVRNLASPDADFFKSWASGIFFRLFFLAAASLVLWNNRTVSAVAFLLGMIFAQFVFQVWPMKAARQETQAKQEKQET
ncbi:MAG: hypothetical protein ABIG11_03845 [bacterium]